MIYVSVTFSVVLLGLLARQLAGFFRVHPRYVALAGLALAVLAAGYVWKRSAEPRRWLAEQQGLDPIDCLVLSSEARPHASGGAALWLQVAWTVDGKPYRLREPTLWWWDAEVSVEHATQGYDFGVEIPCRVDPATPSSIHPEMVARIEAAIAEYQPAWFAVAWLAVLSLVGFFRLRLVYEPPTAVGVRRSKLIQLFLIGSAVVIFRVGDRYLDTWMVWSLGGVAIMAWIGVAARELREEQWLQRAIERALEGIEHWPAPPSDDSGENLYDVERRMGRWHGMLVRVAPGTAQVLMKVAMDGWPSGVFMGPRGSRPGPGVPSGDPAFDALVHLSALPQKLREALDDGTREYAAAVLDATGAVIEDAEITVVLDNLDGRGTFRKLERVVLLAARLTARLEGAGAM